MRAGCVLVIIVMLATAFPPTLAHHGDTLLPYVEESGRFTAGLLAVGVTPVNLAQFTFTAHPCHPRLQVVLEYEPKNASVSTDVLGVSVPFRFQVQFFDGVTDERLPDATLDFTSPGSAWYVLEPEHARGGPLRADLYMLTGAAADWTLRVRGWLQHEGCVVLSEVEANPQGLDAGNEWVELANLGFTPVDVSGWTLRTHAGNSGSMTLPAGTVLEGAGQLVVTFPSQALDNVDEVVSLEAADGVEYARTPPLTDTSNDERTQQLAPETGAAWRFLKGTPGAPNGA